MKKILVLFYICCGITVTEVYAQCPNPRLYNSSFTEESNTQRWVNCIDNPSSPNSYELTVLSSTDIQNYVIVWGDGSPNTTGALLPANTALTHTYTTLGTFNFTLSETRNACTRNVNGVVVNDRKPGASALPPTLGANGCVPHTLTFTNQSSNISPFTTFRWDWGDGEVQTVNHTTAGNPISHTYQPGAASCGMQVRITALSTCDTSFSTYGPYDFWDRDTARITASATELCGSGMVTFNDVSAYNCSAGARRIRWDFTSIGGTNTGWLAATGANRTQTRMVSGNPGDSFVITLEDSNICGIDVESIIIRIIAPPVPILAPITGICRGDSALLTNNSTTGNYYVWDYGYGGPKDTVFTTAPKRHTYDTSGTFTVKLYAGVAGSLGCVDSTTQTVVVQQSSVSNFSMNNTEGCDSLTINFTDLSVGAIGWDWDTNGTVFHSGSGTPPPIKFTRPGTYQVNLKTQNSIGCGTTLSKTVTVYSGIKTQFIADNVCFGQKVKFIDNSELVFPDADSGKILVEKWDNITGTSTTSFTNTGTNPNYPNNPTSRFLIDKFQTPSNVGDNYGQRIRGYIKAPITGNYTFWIASDDNSILLLSSDANPANAVQIASLNGFSNLPPGIEWEKNPSQKSGAVFLQQGQKYYIEARHKEGTGNDFVAVGWQLPTGPTERPIPGDRLYPFAEGQNILTRTWNFGDGSPTSSLLSPERLYATPNTYKVTLNLSTGKCTAKDSAFVTVYDSTRASFNLSHTAGCTPLAVTITNTSANAAKYIWNYGDGSPIDTLTTNTPINKTYANLTTNQVTYTLRLVTISADGCRDTTTRTIKVDPGPVAQFTVGPDGQCSPATLNFSNQSISASSYAWVFAPGDSVLTFGDSTFTKIITNNTGSLLRDTIKLYAYSTFGCFGYTEKYITVLPKPQFGITSFPDAAVCSPGSVNFISTGSPSFPQWTFGDGSSSTNPAPTHVFINPGSNDTVYTVKLKGLLNGCADSVTKDMLVRRAPIADFSLDTNAGCGPLTISITNKSTGADSYEWNLGDGTVTDTTVASFNHVFRNTLNVNQVYTISLTAKTSNGCTQTVTKTVTVRPEIIAAFDMSHKVGCSPITVVFNNNSINNTNTEWTFGDGNGSGNRNVSHTFINNTANDTTYYITMKASAGDCGQTITDSIKVYARPVANFTPSSIFGCAPFAVGFKNNSINGTNYQWSYGDGATAGGATPDSVIHTYQNINAGNEIRPAKLVVTSTSGCKDSVIQNITVYPQVIADINSNRVSGCHPLTVNFSSAASRNATTYIWDFANMGPSGANNPIIEFQNNKTTDSVYQVSLTASSATCTDIAYTTIKVFGRPAPDFAIDTNQGCSPLTVDFNNQSAGITGGYLWDFGDAGTDTTSAATFSKEFRNTLNVNKIYSIKLTGTTDSSCSESVSRSITVFPEIVADFSMTGTIGCSPLTTTFTNNSVNNTSSLWKFGDGDSAIVRNPTHTFYNNNNKDTTFIIQYRAIAGLCERSITDSVRVYFKPVAAFTPSITEGCAPIAAGFKNNSLNAIQYKWHFGDGDSLILSAADSVIHTYNNINPGNDLRQVRLIVNTANDCKDTALSSIITVYPQVVADITASDSIGCSPFPVSFSAAGSKNAGSYAWKFGEVGTSTSPTPNLNFFNTKQTDSVVVVKLIATAGISNGGCIDSTFKSINIYGKPVANFLLDTNQGCHPLPVSIQNLSLLANQIKWTFGDGDTSNETSSPFTHIYRNESSSQRQFDLKLDITSADGCKESMTKQVTALPKITANFVAIPDTIGCSPLSVTFQNTTVPAGTSYTWDFGDGAPSSPLPNPSKQFLNEDVNDTIFKVTLVSRSFFGCVDSTSRNMLVRPKPTPAFTVDISEGCAPLKITVSNNSTAAVYNWNMGDDTVYTTSAASFEHTYQNLSPNSVTREITLNVESASGCINTLKRSVKINPQVIAALSTFDTVGCSPYPSKMIDVSTNAQLYDWSLNNGPVVFTEKNPLFNFINNTLNDSLITIKLLAKSSAFLGSCKDSVERQVMVYHKPKAAFTVSDTNFCAPLTVDFTNLSTGANLFKWNLGDERIFDTTLVDFPHLYRNTSTGLRNYNAQLTAVTDKLCTDIATQPIIVRPEITARIVVTDTVDCSPFKPAFFNNSSQSAATYLWDFGNGQTSDKQTPPIGVPEFINNGNIDSLFKVRLTAFTIAAFNCQHTVEQEIRVHPKPRADFSLTPDSGCQPLDVELTNLSTGTPVKYKWNYDDGNTSDTLEIVHRHIFKNPSNITKTFNVKLEAETAFGCKHDTTREVKVYRQLIPNFDMSLTSGCSPLSVTFTNTTVGGISYTWDLGNGNPLISDQSPPAPEVYINDNLTDTTFSIKLTATSADGCVESITKTITVSPKPKAAYTATYTGNCAPLKVNFANTSTGHTVAYWLYGDGSSEVSYLAGTNNSIDYTFENQTPSPRTYVATLRVENSYGCTDIFNKNIIVNPQVVAAFTPSVTVGCSPLQVSVTNNSLRFHKSDWIMSNDSSFYDRQTPPPVAFVNDSIIDSLAYTIKLKTYSDYGCIDSTERTVYVHAKPNASFDIPGGPFCQPYPMFIQDLSSSNVTKRSWNYGDGNPVSDTMVSHTYIYRNPTFNYRNYILKLETETSKGCKDDTFATVDMYPKVEALFSFSDDSICHNTPTTMRGVNATGGNNLTFIWDFGDGATGSGQFASHSFQNYKQIDTTYKVKLVLQANNNGDVCTDELIIPITVHPAPVADFTFPPPSSNCPPLMLDLQNNSIGAESYTWSYGNGTPDSTMTSSSIYPYTYYNNNDDRDVPHEIRLTARNQYGCTDSDTANIFVNPKVVASYTPLGETIGCSPLSVNFTAGSSRGRGIKYLWESVGPEGREVFFSNTWNATQFEKPDTFDQKLTVTSIHGCTDDTIQKIIVFPTPEPDFEYSPLGIFPGDSVYFTNKTPGDWPKYEWYFDNGGDTIYVKDPTDPQIYRNQGFRNVTLTVTSDLNCSDSKTWPLEIKAKKPEPRISGSGVGCGSKTIELINNSLNGEEYEWYINGEPYGKHYYYQTPDTFEFTFQNLTSNTKPFDVFLRIKSFSGEYSDTSLGRESIIIYPSPIVDFRARPDTIYMPDNVFFSNNSSNFVDEYIWDFGDGNTSNQKNPRHTYTEAGEYTVKLEVKTIDGCTNIDSIERAVIVRAGGRLEMPNAFTPSNNGPGDGKMGGIGLNDIFGPGYHEGVVEYQLQVFNRWGEVLFESKDVEYGWDGYYRGKLCPEGVYVFKARAKFANGNIREFLGDLTLLRN